MSRADVEEIILAPMRACFMPGAHLRGNAEMESRALGEYLLALEHFDRSTLEKTWPKVRDEHELVVWPSVSQFVQTAKIFEPSSSGPSQAEQKRQNATCMKEDKLHDYRKTSKLYQQAKREGWSGELMDFVEGQVWIQAQILASCEGISFNSGLLGKDSRATSSKDALKEICEWIGDRFREEDKLRVKPPPADRIRQWKEKVREQPEQGPLEETLQRLVSRIEGKRGR